MSASNKTDNDTLEKIFHLSISEHLSLVQSYVVYHHGFGLRHLHLELMLRLCLQRRRLMHLGRDIEHGQ